MEKLFKKMCDEYERVVEEDLNDAPDLDEIDNAFNLGWHSGMGRAIQLVREEMG
jgi:hypothetical protein